MAAARERVSDIGVAMHDAVAAQYRVYSIASGNRQECLDCFRVYIDIEVHHALPTGLFASDRDCLLKTSAALDWSLN